jgi:hypothetical protein
METFWAASQNEIRHIGGPIGQRTRSEMRTILFDYIETFYNRTCRQAVFGHCSSPPGAQSRPVGGPSPCRSPLPSGADRRAVRGGVPGLVTAPTDTLGGQPVLGGLAPRRSPARPAGHIP